MNKMIFDIFGHLREIGILNKYPFLGADVMLSSDDISHYQLSPIDRNKYIYIKNIGRDSDIILGEKYNIIFSLNAPKNYINLDCEIDFVSLKRNDNIGVIPRGYGGCVRLKFKDKVPEITKLLVQDRNEKFDKEKNQYIYFTTQEVMDKILEELEKAKNF
ncbi:hypothetical protein [Chryseobacterium indologenes]|uniref:hypothetical protein n=1 Tax=Chryseobacterium indologenes TaxID=253 RepID=UPI003019CEF4